MISLSFIGCVLSQYTHEFECHSLNDVQIYNLIQINVKTFVMDTAQECQPGQAADCLQIVYGPRGFLP